MSTPTWWDTKKDGLYHHLLDAQTVIVDGEFTKCRQIPVDYLGWSDLRDPRPSELEGAFYLGGPSVERGEERLRVPYGFATDHWADTGNVAVFRSDSGADPYEQAQFFISTMENRR